MLLCHSPLYRELPGLTLKIERGHEFEVLASYFFASMWTEAERSLVESGATDVDLVEPFAAVHSDVCVHALIALRAIRGVLLWPEL